MSAPAQGTAGTFYRGSCPHCGAELRYTSPPSAVKRCDSCGGGLLVAIPEAAPDDAGPVELHVQPAAGDPVGRALESSGLRKPIRRLITAAVILVCILGAGAVVLFVAPPGTLSNIAGAVAGLALVTLLFTPVVLGLSVAAVRFGIGDARRARDFSYVRSVGAVAGVVLLMPFAGSVLLAIRQVLEIDAESPPWMTWGLFLLGNLVGPIVAGWLTARLARVAPYRHALCVLLVLVLCLGAFLLTVAGARAAAPSLAYLVFAPLLLLGAWLHVRATSRA